MKTSQLRSHYQSMTIGALIFRLMLCFALVVSGIVAMTQSRFSGAALLANLLTALAVIVFCIDAIQASRHR